MPDPTFDFFAYLKKLESDPRFASLSFDDQFKQRSQAIDESLGMDPRYTYMEPQAFAELKRGILLRPPVAETPEVQAEITSTQGKLMALEDANEGGVTYDENNPFWRKALKWVGTGGLTGAALAMTGPLGAAATFMIGKASGVEREALRESAKSTLLGVEKNTGFFGLPNAVAKWAPKVFYNASKEVDRLVGGGRESPITKALKNSVDAVNKGQQYQRDWDKWERYTDLLFSEQDQDKLLSHANVKQGVVFGAQAAELMAIPNESVSVPLNALARKMTSPAIRTGLGVLRGAANLGAESGMEMVRQYAIEFSNQTENDPQLNTDWGHAKKVFTEKVVGNVVGKTLFNGARVAFKDALHIIKNKGLLDTQGKFLPLQDLEEEIRKLTYSQGVDPTVIRNAGKAVEDGVVVTNSMLAVGKGVSDIPEETALKVIAYDSGFSLLPGKSPGTWDLVDLDRGSPTKHFSSWEGVQTHFGKEMGAAAVKVGRDLKVSVAAAKTLQLNVTPEYLQHLGAKRNVPVEQTADGVWKVGGEDFPDSVSAAKALLSDKVLPDGKVSDELAPDVVLSGPDIKTTNYVAPGVVQGPLREVLQHLEGFSKGKVYEKVVSTVDGSRIEKDVALNLFRVTDASTNFTREFQSSGDAIRWLNEGDGTLFKLRGVAAGKGYKLDFVGGRYVIHSNDHNLSFDSLVELRKGLKSLPNPEHVPELTGFGEMSEELGIASGMKFSLDPYTRTPTKKPFTTFLKIDEMASPVDRMMSVVANHAGLPPSLGVKSRELAVAAELTRKETALWEKAFMESLTPSWAKGGRHILSSPENIEIYKLIREVPSRDKVAQILGEYSANSKKPVNVGEWLEVYDRTRKFYGETPLEGIGGFNLIGQTAKEGPWVLGYATRKFKDFASKKGGQWWGDDADVISLAREAGIREEHLPFFRHARKADINDMASDDPMKATLSMIRMSMREKYFNPAMDAFEKEVDAIGKSGKFDDTVISYLQHVEGLFNGKTFAKMDAKESSKWIKDNIIARIPGLDPNQSKTLLDAWMSMGYTAGVGFNVFKVARNAVEQPFTVLAGRVGLPAVIDTYKELATNPKAFFEMADAHGVLSSGGEVAKAGGTKAGFGMGRYMRSDDLSRVVAYMAARKPISLAIEQVKSGIIKPGDLPTFLKSSKLRVFEPDDQVAILKKLNSGDTEGAIDLYARTVSADTMVPMWRALRPGAIRKTTNVGKIFGHFGTYSFSWTDNIRRGVSRGTVGDRLSWVTNLAAGSGMLMGAMAAAGVKPEMFNPLQPLGFTGGPGVDIAYLTLKSQPFSDTYTARQSRAQLIGLKTSGGKLTWDMKSFSGSKVGSWMVPIPGWVYWKSFEKLPDYMNKGQYYRAFLTVTGAPTNPEYFGDK